MTAKESDIQCQASPIIPLPIIIVMTRNLGSSCILSFLNKIGCTKQFLFLIFSSKSPGHLPNQNLKCVLKILFMLNLLPKTACNIVGEMDLPVMFTYTIV